jgi:CubicO group peptidase (beta-lactamase class C family)
MTDMKTGLCASGWIISAILLLFVMMSCTAEEPGETVSGFSEADSLIQAALSDDLFTGAVLLIGDSGEIVHYNAYGYATLYDENLRVVERPDSTTIKHLFDLASLTKIFSTTYALMALHSDGRIGLDDPISQYLPDFDTQEHRRITVRQLLNHSSGLSPWYPLYYRAENPAERREVIRSLPIAGDPGESRQYSDLGFMLLADIVESITDSTFEQYLNDRIYSRLGLRNTVFNPLEKGFVDLVSTSHGNPFERKMIYDPDFGYSIDVDPSLWDEWRDYSLRGEVNDGNSWYANGGVAGHAGLFSTAVELWILLQPILNAEPESETGIFAPETVRAFTTEDDFGNGLGWAMEPSVLHANSLPEGAIGHTGFTGTNFVAVPHPDGGRVYILLTNRQHVGVNADGTYPSLRDLREKMSSIVF